MLTARPSGSSAIPVCCSTVTPGKFATFWRSPVRRLKSVVLPELGGPTSATVRTAAGRGSCATAEPPQPWQSAAIAHGILECCRVLVRTFKRRAVSRRSAISEPSTWKTRGSPPGALNPAVMLRARQETEFHQAARIVGGQDRCGREWPHRPFAGPPGLRGRLLAGLLPLSCNMVSVCSSPKSLSRGSDAACRVFFSPWCSRNSPSAPK